MSASPEKPEEDLVFDETFVASAGFKEPSARERKGNPLTRRLAERRRRKAMVKQWRSPQYRRGRRPGARTVATLLVVGLVAAVLVEKNPLNMWSSHSPATAAVTSPVPVTSPMPGEPTSEGSDPFAGSPAKSYADGASGITLPTARATGGLQVKDVELLLRKTRALLTASDLDPGTLFGGDTGSFARQLDPEQRRYFTSSLRSKDQKKNARSWLVNFAPKTAELTGSIIKVHGESTLSAATRPGRRGALVQVNYVFVYPVHPPLQPETTIRVVAQLHGEVFRFRDASGGRTWIYRWETFQANARCDAVDGYVHPDYPGARLDMTESRGVPVDPYDLKDDVGSDKGCRTATRT